MKVHFLEIKRINIVKYFQICGNIEIQRKLLPFFPLNESEVKYVIKHRK